MAEKKARDDDADRKFIEREQALAEERRYADFQQRPHCGKAGGRHKGTPRDKRA